jgi:hypothetical protein
LYSWSFDSKRSKSVKASDVLPAKPARPAVAEAAHLCGAGLHHRLVERDLAVAADPPPGLRGARENGRSVEHREMPAM